MSTILAKEFDPEVICFIRHCPKCGGELDSQLRCIDCTFSDETSLTEDEAREFTMAGD